MSIELTLGTAASKSLENAVQSKLIEAGWSTGGLDDTSLAEYIVLMIANGKTREQIANELATDFLELGPEDASVVEFSRWLFDQAQSLSAQSGELPDSDAQDRQAAPTQGQSGESYDDDAAPAPAQDAEMGDAADNQDTSIPTGPKSMRNAPVKSRDKRILGQTHKAMDRSNEGVLHRIKGAAGGAGRINSHNNRDAPKGPTPRGPRATMQRNTAPNAPQRNMNNMQMNGMPQGPPFGTMTPQQQMQLFAMYEEQARMMAQILSPQQQQQMFPNQMAVNQNGFPGQQQQQQPGRSLFERVDSRGTGQHGQFGRKQHDNSQAPMNGASTGPDIDPASSMEVEPGSQNVEKQDHENTMCRFNLSCTKPDCYFVHQSPAAPPGVAIDMTDTCAFGAACKNRKCTGKHPSPAKLGPQRAEQDCKFFPNCTNPSCPFRHPSMPPCRNGADCKVEGCKFSHSKVVCKYDPCLNPACPFKHVEGQKRGAYADKVWINSDEGGGGEGGKQHVSDRKFVDEAAGEEELILPGAGGGQEESVQSAEGIVT